jgi:hypothetical protein
MSRPRFLSDQDFNEHICRSDPPLADHPRLPFAPKYNFSANPLAGSSC